MADHPAAMNELRSLLREREPVYGQAAVTVDTSWKVPEEIATDIENQLSRVHQD
jgi:shikimate kinase